MTTLYLVIALVGGNPQAQLYATESEACTNFPDGAKVYSVEGKSGKWKLTEGECATVKGFRKK